MSPQFRAIAKLVALMIVAALCGCSRKPPVQQGPSTYRTAGPDIQVGPQEKELPADIVLLLDQSGSMSVGASPTDREGLRVSGSRFFVESIAQRSTREQPNRFGVVSFGTHAERRYTVPLTEIRSSTDTALQCIFEKLTPLNLGDTSFIEALQLGMQLLREKGSFDQPRNRALVVFTDGEPDDPRKLSVTQYFSEISNFVQAQVKPAGVDIFVVGIDAAGKRWSATVPYWREIVGSNHVFTTPSMEALRAQFIRIVQRIWHLPEVPPVSVSSARPVEFEIEPYLSAVEFCIFPSREGLALRVRRPDGRVVEPGRDPDVPPVKHLSACDLLAVQDPEPGRWRYEVVGTGTIEVLRNPIPLRMRLVSPALVHPQGKPMRLIAEFRRRDGKPVESDQDYPLALSANIVTPSGKTTSVKFPLEQGREGIYVGEPALEAPMEIGEYKVMLKVSGGEKFYSENPVPVQVRRIPYVLVDVPEELAAISPAPALPIRARLLMAGKPLDPQQAFTNHPDYLVLAQIVENPQGKRGKAVWMNLAGPGRLGQFVGTVPVPEVLEGRHVLVVKLAPEEKEKQEAADQSIVAFVMQYPPAPLWRRALLRSFIVLIVVVASAYYIRKRIAKKLRLTIFCWPHDKSTFEVLTLRSANERRGFPGVPITVTRIGKSSRVKISPREGATLLTPDGRALGEVEVSEQGALVHVQVGSAVRALIVTLYNPPGRRPEAPAQTPSVSEETTAGGATNGPHPAEGGFDWGFSKEDQSNG